MVRALLVNIYQIKLLLKSWAFLLVLYSLLHTSIFHFLFNLRHTKPIENLNV